MSTHPTTNNPEQQALQAIEEQYEAAMAFVQAMKNDAGKEQYDQSQIAKIAWQYRDYDYGWIQTVHGGWTYVNNMATRLEAPYKADEAAAEADLKAKESALKALDPTFQSLCDSLDSLIHCIEGGGGHGVIEFGLTGSTLQNFQKIMNSIFDAMKQKLQSDMYLAELSSSASGQMTTQQLAELAAESVQYQAAESGTLNSVMTSLTNLITQYHTAYNNADIDLNSYNFWDELASAFGAGDADEKEGEDKMIMANAQAMIKTLTEIMTALAPEVAAASMSQFTSLIDTIEMIVKEIKKILAQVATTPGALKAQQKQILALVMFLLTFFQLVKQNVETEKAKNNQDMTEGVIKASQANIDDSMTNQKIYEEEQANAAIMKWVMLASEIAIAIPMIVMSDGVLAPAVIATVSTLQALQTAGAIDVIGAITGWFAKYFESLGVGDKTAQILGDVSVALIEIGLTMGASSLERSLSASFLKAGIQAAAASATAAAQTANQVIEEEVQAAITQMQVALEAAGKQTLKGEELAAAQTTVRTTLTNVARISAEKAAQGAAAQFMRQNFITLITLAYKKAFTTSLEDTMENAAEDAIQTAVKEASAVAKLAARGIQSTDEVIDGIATKAANESVARISGKTVEKVAKEAAATKMGNVAWAGIYAAAFATGNTNLITDILKKEGLSDDILSEIMQMLQQLMQMLSLMLGSGMLSGSTIEGIMNQTSNLPRIVGILQTAPQAVQAAGSYGTYLTEEGQASAVTALNMNGSVADLLHAFIDQLQKDANLDRDIMIKEQSQEAQSTASMAGHLHDGDNAEIQILISAAG